MIILSEETVRWVGCDAALIGIGVRCGQPDIAVYDYEKLVGVFMDQGMDEEEAKEWIDFNVNGQWIGEKTPMVVYPILNEGDVT